MRFSVVVRVNFDVSINSLNVLGFGLISYDCSGDVLVVARDKYPFDVLSSVGTILGI